MRRLFILLAALPVIACGESNDGRGAGVDTQTPANTSCQKSGYSGDDRCLEPPDPDKGIQLHVGPASYGDADVAPFLLSKGKELVECYYLKTPNTEPVYYFEQENRMRPGSHHMIIRLLDEDHAPGWGTCERAAQSGGIPGSQTEVRDIPGVEIAPENAGLGRVLPPNKTVQFELHYFNTGERPVLREAWVNLHFKDPAEVTGTIRGIGMIGGLGMDVPPQTRQILNYSCDVGGDVRIFELFGHYHAHTERFSAWRVRGERRELVYESFDWHEPATLVYDSVNTNPPPDRDTLEAGGWSGPLEVKQGDRFEWECEVNNTLNQRLRFANEALTAEMCILFGGYVAENAVPMSCFR